MAKRRTSIKRELQKIVRRRLSDEELSEKGIPIFGRKSASVIEALALAQVKKGLEGDLKAAMFIEELLGTAEDDGAQSYDVVVRVVGGQNGN